MVRKALFARGDANRHGLGGGYGYGEDGDAAGDVGGVELDWGSGVRAEDLVDASASRLRLAFGYEHGGDIGEVELALRVVCGEGIELAEERFVWKQ